MPAPVKISVIIPAYNVESTIDRAIHSVLAQQGASFELLAGDDGSTDDTWKRMIRYRSDPRVQIFRSKENQGAASARNWLAAKAIGRYLSLCDADDRLCPGNLRALSRALDRHPRMSVAYTDIKVIFRNGRSRIWRRFVSRRSWDLLGGSFPNGGAMIRRSFFKKAGGYRTRFPYLEDCDLFLRLAERAPLLYVPGKPLYHQYKRTGSLSDQPRKELRRVSLTLFRDAVRRRFGYRVRW